MEEKIYKYLEVVDHSSDSVVKRMDVTEKSWNGLDTLERGLNRNLNHEEYFARVTTTNEPLEIF